MRFILLCLIPVGFCVAFWLGSSTSRVRGDARLRKTRVNYEFGEISSYKAALAEIREGRTSSAVEYLEFSVDCLVSRLWSKQAEADGPTRERIFQALKEIKRYRNAWPREVKGEVLAGERLSANEIEMAAQEARQILGGL
jgi:hypothetical protein